MSRTWYLLALYLVLGTPLGCDSSTGDTGSDATSDTGSPDAAADARDTADTRDTADAGPEWPEQEQGDEEPSRVDWQMPEAGDSGFTVLVANLGNIDFRRCNDVAFNLCWTELEQTITARIAELAPDVVMFQEVLDPAQCDAVENPPEDHVCQLEMAGFQPPQARRLLGPDYTVVCDARNGYECIGVHTDFGTINGCEEGELCPRAARTAPPVEGCDEGFTLSAVTVAAGDTSFDVINGHPPSDAAGATEGRECRTAYFEHVFGAEATLVTSDTVVLGGDFNFDPYRQSDAYPDITLWNTHVGFTGPTQAGDSPAFAYHSGVVEHDPPYWTSPLSKTTLDHVVSTGLVGRCVTLGAHPGLAPLDMGIGDQISRLDHLAQWCTLDFAP